MTDTPTWHCTCGNEVADSFAFCQKCGTSRATAEAAEAAAAPETCANCGRERVPEAMFCGGCGASFDDQKTAVHQTADAPTTAMPVYPAAPVDDVEPYTPPVTHAQETRAIPPAQAASSFTPPIAPPPPTGPQPPRQKNNALLIGLIAACTVIVLLLIAGGVYLLTRDSGNSKSSGKKSSTTSRPVEQKEPISVPAQLLATANDDATVTWANTKPTAATLRDARASGTRLNTLATTQSPVYAAVTDAKREHQASIMGQVATAEATLGSALAALPAKSENITDAQLTAIATALTASRAAWATAQAAQLPVPHSLTGGVATDPAPALRKFAADFAALRSWTGRMDSLIRESVNGRGDLQAIFSSVVACNLDPDTAASKLDSIALNRQTVLDQVASLDPPTPAARNATDTFHTALQHSHEADRHYASWVRNQTSWYYTTPVGCLGGNMPSDSDKNAGDYESTQATAAKRRFVQQYNPIARSFGKPTWTESQI